MPSTYTANLNLELQATGENAGSWGSLLNSNDFQILDQAIGGVQALTLSNTNITVTTSQSQNNFLVLAGVLTANVAVIFPAIGRTYQVMNATTGGFTVTMQIGSPASGAVTGVPQGGVQTIVMDGTNVYLISGGTPTGAIGVFATPTPPFGWLECNFAAVSRSTYPALNNQAALASYAAPWGPGDGSTTFNVPDLRGYFVRGWDHSAGRDPGRTFGSTQADAFKAHLHGVTDPGHDHTSTLDGATPPSLWSPGSGAQKAITRVGANVVIGALAINNSTTGISIQNTGSTETRPINVAMLYAIKW